jgi:hypothetical protein
MATAARQGSTPIAIPKTHMGQAACADCERKKAPAKKPPIAGPAHHKTTTPKMPSANATTPMFPPFVGQRAILELLVHDYKRDNIADFGHVLYGMFQERKNSFARTRDG